MKHSKIALIKSTMALLLCVSMLAGTTFAWFTDSVVSQKNRIQAGKLDVEFEYLNDANQWVSVQDSTTLFDEEALWEPGHTEVVYLRVSNKGNLALRYQLGVNIVSETGSVNKFGANFKLSDYIRFGVKEGVNTRFATRTDAMNAITESSLISGGYLKNGNILVNGSEQYLAMVVYMPEEVGNEANSIDATQQAKIELGINLVATQDTVESDGFGSNYDSGSIIEFPAINTNLSLTADVEVAADGTVADPVSLMSLDGSIFASIPEGVLLEDGVTTVTFSIKDINNSEANITLDENEITRSVDVHIEGISENNIVPILVTVKEMMPVGLNMGNYEFYHVEDGITNLMTLVDTAPAAHNEFSYDPATGDVTMALTSFSEIALVADTENAWKGDFDYTWYDASKTELSVANADQLAALGAIVGGMNGQTQDSFAGKTVRLISDINLGDKESENNSDLIFYPIGYYNSNGSYEKTSGGSVTSSVSSFEGTFDGNGHTISNFYQNTWEMFGDYNDGYSGTPNHYKDAMGLFGYVLNGTIKNLTVDNFSSDGEFTPTGVVAAYADGKTTFENIAITNCNPRVYNTGNGGIIGIAGDTSAANDDHITLKNITVDNSNKISALWGSWDVACGGLVGMYRGNVDGSGNATGDTISFENCHVSAIIDVYNDVCANYQYYAYRYSGMIIGSVRHNTKNTEGKTIPNMTGISATGCTVNYGDWNDYYYCEFEKNTMASYSEDYQFSRVPHSELKFTDSNGNGVVDTDERASVTGCKHTHTAEENHQAIYLPFHQLFTGYSWGVSSIGLKEYSGIATDLGITEGEQNESVEKFKVSSTFKPISENLTIRVGDMFEKLGNVSVNDDSVQVAVSDLNNTGITGEYVASKTGAWEDGTLTLNKIEGLCKITIQDYQFCEPTCLYLKDGKLYGKFSPLFNNENYLYRVGNKNKIALASLFAGTEIDVDDTKVSVKVTDNKGEEVGKYYKADCWKESTLYFENYTGLITVEISEQGKFKETLNLEVVDAVNATTATNATSNNVVLLNNCEFGSLEVSGGYTLYGNGFTMTCGSDSAALDMGYAFVTLNNGTLDNVQIVCPNYDYAALYKSNLTSSENRSETTDRTRYYNAKSAVMASGNSHILNSRISGARAAVNVSGGNLVIDNSRIELGAVASILVGAANNLTLRDVTLIQKPTTSTHDSSKTLMGFSVLYMCDSEGKATPTTLEGSLVQQAWVDENDKQYVPSAAQDIVEGILKETAFIHNIDGKDSLNLGFAYMPEDAQKTVDTPDNITDNRTDKATIPYEMKDVKIQISILSTTVYVYSYKNTNGTADSFKTESEYTPNEYGDIITVTYSDTSDGLTTGKSFDTDGWVYELNVDLDKLSGYELDFSKLSMSVNGVTVTDYKVNDKTKPISPIAVTAGGVTYTLTATVNEKEYTATYKVTGTETSKESPSLVASNYEAGLCVASSYGGKWHGAAPALQGIQIKYWSVAEKQYKTINLFDYTPTTKGQLNGTNTTWTYSPANGDFTLTLTGGQVHSSNKVNAMPVVCDGKLYFVAANSNGLVNSGNSARTIPVTYSFKDNNNGKELKFSHTWSVEENKDDQYKYSDFCNGTKTKLEKSSDGSCLAAGTKITMKDGTKRAVEDLRKGDLVMSMDHLTGKLTAQEVIIVVKTASTYFENTFVFDDGTRLVTINEHGIYDFNLNQYVNISRENAHEYVGHRFVAIDSNGNISSKKLMNVNSTIKTGHKYDIVTDQTLNYVAEDTLSVTHVLVDVINTFDFAKNMVYDADKMRSDIEKYGVYTYDEWKEHADRNVFEQYNIPVMKVGIEKGLYTKDYIIHLINTYVLDESVQIIN